MLARYPKVEATHAIKGSSETTAAAATSSTKKDSSSSTIVCPILPRLCIDDEYTFGGREGCDKAAVATLDWSSLDIGGRGCDSAPVVAENRESSIDDRFFFVLGDHVHRHHQHYPRCLRQQIVGAVTEQATDDQQDKTLSEGGKRDSSSSGDSWPSAEENDTPSIRTAVSSSAFDDVSSDVVILAMDVSPEEDFKRLCGCVHLLQCSGYYYEGLSWQQATLKLRKCRVGTFLIRDSENANYLFTLSVQTKKGPTSVRIAYKGGRFRLDSDEDLVSRMPVFDNVTDLVEHYIKISRESRLQKNVSCCWLDLAGECSAPVELYYPLYKQVHSLKHLSRLNVVKQLKCSTDRNVEWTLEHSRSLCLPMALKEYIKEYSNSH